MSLMVWTPELKLEYEQRLARCQVQPMQRAACLALCGVVVKRKLSGNYDAVSQATGVPWFFIALVHQMESSGNFKTHLHNGDPLTHRTVHVPAGRPFAAPATGAMPYPWSQSATDALRLQGLDKWRDWSAGGVLFQLERYNGFGYRRRGLPSPYLWAKSCWEKPGKFTGDGHFDPHAISQQIGAATLLHTMLWLKLVELAA